MPTATATKPKAATMTATVDAALWERVAKKLAHIGVSTDEAIDIFLRHLDAIGPGHPAPDAGCDLTGLAETIYLASYPDVWKDLQEAENLPESEWLGEEELAWNQDTTSNTAARPSKTATS